MASEKTLESLERSRRKLVEGVLWELPKCHQISAELTEIYRVALEAGAQANPGEEQ